MSFKRSFALVIGFVFLAVPQPSKATYWDTVLLQYLLGQMQYIQEFINKVGFAAEQYVSYVSEFTKLNGAKQATEIKVGAIAEQTKTLGAEMMKDNFYIGPELQIDGKRYKVASVASSGCFGMKISETMGALRDKKPALKQSIEDASNDLVNSPRNKEEQFASGVMAIKDFLDDETPTSFFNSNKTLNESELMRRSNMASMLANKKLFIDEKDSKFLPGGESAVDLYKTYTASIASVLNDDLIKSYGVNKGFNSAVSAKDIVNLSSAQANNHSLTIANNLKVEKGRKAQQVENAYRLLNIKIEQLDRQRKQEQLMMVLAHQALNKMHKKVQGIR